MNGENSWRGSSGVLACLVLLAWIGLPARGDEPADHSSRYGDRWVYCSFNLQVEKSVDDLIALIARASRAGYTGIVLADYKLQVLHRVPDFYFRNVERVKAAAARAHIELIPTVFSIGYSNGILAHDPNLAEGLPVIDQPYLVKDRALVLDSRPAVQIKNGSLEQSRGDQFTGFNWQDDPGVTTFADRSIRHQGRVACRLEPGNVVGGKTSPNLRLTQTVKLRPHTAYRFSCWLKTRGLSPTGSFHLLALGTGAGGRQLTFHEGGVEPTQDWKRIDVVFNSLDEREANLYVGFWGGGQGTIWIDDLAIDELALVNVLRRGGCPLEVRSADGKTTYDEGRDFEPVVDSKLGSIPWEGEYEFDHAGPVVRITPRSRIKNGDRVRVSWYHPVITHGSQIMCCLSEPKVESVMADQARRVNELLHPRTFFMSHDEIRVANWCLACQKRGLTPGQLLAENARRSTAILRSINPQSRVVVWSDMFDPHHNAVDKYYLVNGSLKGSWEGLGREVLIANWNGDKAAESLRFFADRGHQQIIAGYYDVADLSNFRHWDSAARNVRGVIGFMYTTWQANYGLLERYGAAMRENPALRKTTPGSVRLIAGAWLGWNVLFEACESRKAHQGRPLAAFEFVGVLHQVTELVNVIEKGPRHLRSLGQTAQDIDKSSCLIPDVRVFPVEESVAHPLAKPARVPFANPVGLSSIREFLEGIEDLAGPRLDWNSARRRLPSVRKIAGIVSGNELERRARAGGAVGLLDAAREGLRWLSERKQGGPEHDTQPGERERRPFAARVLRFRPGLPHRNVACGPHRDQRKSNPDRQGEPARELDQERGDGDDLVLGADAPHQGDHRQRDQVERCQRRGVGHEHHDRQRRADAEVKQYRYDADHQRHAQSETTASVQRLARIAWAGERNAS